MFRWVLLLLLGIQVSCAPLRPLEFQSVKELKVENALLAPKVSASLHFFNPNSVGCTVKKFDLDVFINAGRVTSVAVGRQRLPANSEFSVPLSATVPYSELLKLLAPGLSSFQEGKKIPLELKGSVTLKKFLFSKTYPVHYTEQINLKELIR